MKNYLSSLDHKTLTYLKDVSREADRKRGQAYLVGGIVRDIILKRKNLDLDFVIRGDAIALARISAKKWKAKLTQYAQFKTATCQCEENYRVDFATARKEQYPRSGDLPVVQLGNLRDDLYRRDFTINAMAIAIHKSHYGQLIDEFGGLTDIKKKRLRVLHAKSFIDDPTRILRAIRFEQRFRYSMERQTLQLLKKALKKNLPKNVKAPRYFAEFKKMLMEEDPLSNLRRLKSLNGLEFIDPRLKADFRILSRVHRQMCKNRKDKTPCSLNIIWLFYFMALLEGISISTLKRILGQYHLRREDRKSLLQMQKTNAYLKQLSTKGLTPSQVYRILGPLTPETVQYLRIRSSKKTVRRRIDQFWHKDAIDQVSVLKWRLRCLPIRP